jgi:hypothetical protein
VLRLIETTFFLVASLACAVAQDAGLSPEKHTKNILAEQPPTVIMASPLCQQVRDSGKSLDTRHPVDPATLEPDLASLIQKSDEVVLVGNTLGTAEAISPNGKDTVTYVDARVLRTWKGSHKPGDLITYALPFGGVLCEPQPEDRSRRPLMAGTSAGLHDFEGYVNGSRVLFLRQSRGNEMLVTPRFRLTGGDGFQGMYGIEQMPVHVNACYTDNYQNPAEVIPKCNAILDISEEPVFSSCGLDSPSKKYVGAPMSSFLKEMQSVADSLSSVSQPAVSK